MLLNQKIHHPRTLTVASYASESLTWTCVVVQTSCGATSEQITVSNVGYHHFVYNES